MIEKLTDAMVMSGATWVLWLLFALSVISLAIAIERAWVLRGAGGDTALLVRELRRCLREGDSERAKQLLEGARNVPASIVRAGLAEADLGHAAAEEAMAAAAGLERARLEKRLLFLGTVGNNAPFVGLLGTVIGIVGAFEALGKPQAMTQAIAASASLAPERVMATIAEALVATAVGLLVAIPAVAAFNALQARVSALLADAETLGHVLLGQLKAEREPERESELAGRIGRRHTPMAAE
jgi:biopolymer transport protein ExbB